MVSTMKKLAGVAVAILVVGLAAGAHAEGSIVAGASNHEAQFDTIAPAPSRAGQPHESLSAPALTDIPVLLVGPADLETQTPDFGSIVAWGYNLYGQCNVPAPNVGFVAVAAGAYHSFGLKSDGSIVAWGWNNYGQCNVPSPNTGFVAVAAGNEHSLRLKSDGSIVAWGRNDFGQCNVPPPNTGFVAIAARGDHGLGLKSGGSIVAWGYNSTGQCNVPEPNTGFVAVAAGGYASLGLKSDGSIVAWGWNNSGQCNVPSPNTGFVAVAAGGGHSLGLKSDGSIVAWGYNLYGQCNVPWPNVGFVAVAAGTNHSLGLKSDGSIVAWGYNLYGECNVPEPNTGFVKVATGGLHGLALQLRGWLRVTIEPAAAVADGARWSVDGGTRWLGSGISLTLPPANYVVQFKDAGGWDSPSPQNVTVLRDQVTTTTGTYIRHPGTTGTLVVTIQPAGAVSMGAKWSVNGGTTWRNSGTSVVLPVGTRTVRFNAVAGRVTPPNQAVTINQGETTQLAVYYNAPPTVGQVSISPSQPRTLDTIQAIAVASDPDGHAIVAYQYEWLRGGVLVATAPTLDPQYTAKGQQWQLRVRARDSVGDWGAWAALSFTIANTPPTQPVVEIRPRVPSPTSDLIVYILEYSVDPDGDVIGYDFQWFMSNNNGQTWIHKAELDGSPQVNHLYIAEGELWNVHYVPYEKASPAPTPAGADGKGLPVPLRVEGPYGWDQVYVGRNSLPQMQFTRLAGMRDRAGNVRLTIEWSWQDADRDACTVQLYWTDRGVYGLRSISGVLPATQRSFITTVRIPSGVRVYVHGVIKDAKGAVTRVTSGAVNITQEGTAASPAWLRAE